MPCLNLACPFARHSHRAALLHCPATCFVQVRRYREQRDIHVTGEGVPKPVSTFEEASFPGEHFTSPCRLGGLGWLGRGGMGTGCGLRRWGLGQRSKAAHCHAWRFGSFVSAALPTECPASSLLCLPEYVLAEVNRAGFKEPSPIQAQGWPMALLGRDLVSALRMLRCARHARCGAMLR